MPSFYLNAPPQPMALTPQDFYGSCTKLSHDTRQLPALRLSSHGTRSSNHDFGRSETLEVRTHYPQYPQISLPRTTYPQENIRQPQLGYPAPEHSPLNLPGRASTHLLPSIRVQDYRLEDHQKHAQNKSAPSVTHLKEEKPMGGVAAHLDYDMDEMVNFVSKTAQGMYDIYGSRICLADIDMSRSVVDSKNHVHPEVRKYVSQVLSSTRLPSSTILLGLHYLATRMTLLSVEGHFKYGGGQLQRMLTTALLLGSKFLDDNTFQNRSWSEVSNIPVSDLNLLEVEWLMAIDWDMHFDPRDPTGFLLWYQQWQRYQIRNAAKVEPLVQTMKQTHLDGITAQTHQRFHYPSSPARREPHADDPTSHSLEGKVKLQWITPRYDSWPHLRSQTEHSPPSAPETGPNTPDWYGTLHGFGYGGVPHNTYPPLKLPAPLQVAESTASKSAYHVPFAQQYPPYGHGNTCLCGYCMSHNERFIMAPGYGLQSVVG